MRDYRVQGVGHHVDSRSYVVYRFDDGFVMTRNVFMDHERSRTVLYLWEPKTPSMGRRMPCATIDVPRDWPGLGSYRLSHELMLHDTEWGEGTRYWSPTARMDDYFMTFLAQCGVKNQFMYFLPSPVLVDERFDAVIDQISASPTATVEDLVAAVEGLQGVQADVFDMDHLPKERLRANLYLNDTRHVDDLVIMANRIEDDDPLCFVNRWRLFGPKWTSPRVRIEDHLSSAWRRLKQAMIDQKAVFILRPSEEESFWAAHHKPGAFSFDPAPFDLLGVELPVLLPDAAFLEWAEAAGLEQKSPW